MYAQAERSRAAVASAAFRVANSVELYRSDKSPLSMSRPSTRGNGFTQQEIQQRREMALKVVQQQGLPDIINRVRTGTPAAQEEAVKTLSFIATHDGQCAGMIVAAGGLPPLIPLLSVQDGIGDDDVSLDLKEQTVKCLRDLCLGEKNNQLPIAERGAIPPLLQILTEVSHPWSIREAAAEALALLVNETAGGPAQEITYDCNGLEKMIACYKEAECTAECRYQIKSALRDMAMLKPAAFAMRKMGILQPREQNPDTDDPMPGMDEALGMA